MKKEEVKTPIKRYNSPVQKLSDLLWDGSEIPQPAVPNVYGFTQPDRREETTNNMVNFMAQEAATEAQIKEQQAKEYNDTLRTGIAAIEQSNAKKGLMSSLAGLSDVLTKSSGNQEAGTNLQASMPKPVDEATLMNMKSKLMPTKVVPKSISSDMMKIPSLLGYQRQLDIQEKNRYDQQKALSKQEIIDNRLTRKEVKRDFDKVEEDLYTNKRNVDTIRAMIETGKWATVKASSSFLSRLFGEKGVLTDYDVQKVIPTSLLTTIASMQNFITSSPDAPLPKDLAKMLKDNIDILESTVAKINRLKAQNLKESLEQTEGYSQHFAEDGIGTKKYNQIMKTLKTMSPSLEDEASDGEADLEYDPVSKKFIKIDKVQ